MKRISFYLLLMGVAFLLGCPPQETFKGISLNVSEKTLPVEESFQLKVAFEPASMIASVSWSSSNDSVASVSQSGVVTTKALGEAIITAKANEFTATCVVKVISYITLNEAEKSLPVNDLFQLEATLHSEIASETVEWSSSDESVATIDQSGKVSTKNEGTANITAQVGNHLATCIIRVLKPETVNKSAEINPLHISIARLSEIDGTPQAKATALFNYGGEMEYLLLNLLKDEDKEYDWEKGSWSGKIVDADSSNAVLATITNAPYKKRVEFDLDLNKVYNVKLQDAVLDVPHSTVPGRVLKVSFTFGSERFFGSSIAIRNTADFQKKLYIKDGLRVEAGTAGAVAYDLVMGDDFNYHFNGLNYKSHRDYFDVADDENLDKEAFLYNSRWDSEYTVQGGNKGAYPRKDISSWDIRNAETRNGVLLSKVLTQDVDKQTIYLGHNQTKPVTGYTDLVKGSNGESLSGLTGATRSKTVRFGYVEGKVRVKKKGYNSNTIPGPWYAFWLHGDMHEYDIMEFLGLESNKSELVIHWHNGWGSYGGNPGSSWIGYNVPQNYEEEWWTLGLYWDEEKVVYNYNGKMFLKMTRNEDNSAVSFNISNGAWSKQSTGNRNFSGNTTNYSKNINPQMPSSSTPISYNSNRLKAIMDVPMNIFVSTELASGGWGGTFNRNWNALPLWLECDYVAYYLPNVAIEGVAINEKESYQQVFVGTPDFKLTTTISPDNVPAKDVKWESSNTSVATISSTGVVSIKGQGKTTIKATSLLDNSKSDSFEMTIMEAAVPVEGVEIVDKPDSLITLGKGNSQNLTASVKPETASVKNIVWTASPAGIVRLTNENSNTVTVTGMSSGTATVTVTTTEGNFTDSVEVTVVAPQAPETFSAFGLNFTKSCSFEFASTTLEEEASFEPSSNFKIEEDMMKATCGSDKPKLKIANVGENDKFVLIRATYSGSPNAYIATDTGKHQYLRVGSDFWVTLDWVNGSHHSATWTDQTTLYGVYAHNGSYGFYQLKNPDEGGTAVEYIGELDTVDLGGSINLVFEGTGSVNIEYVGIYTSTKSIPSASSVSEPLDEVVLGGVTYTLQQAYNFENSDGLTLPEPLTPQVSGGKLTLNMKDGVGENDLVVPVSENKAVYAEVRMRFSNANVYPHIGFNTWACLFLRNNREGTPGNGFTMGFNNHSSVASIEPDANKFATYGIVMPNERSGQWNFFFNGSQVFSQGCNSSVGYYSELPIANQSSYKLFLSRDGGGAAGTVDIDYIAFYTTKN